MKKSGILLIIGIVAVVFIGGYYYGSETGIISSTASAYPNSTELSTATFSSLMSGTDFEIDDYEQAVDDLNIRIYGVTGSSASDVIDWYNLENAKDGWSSYGTERDSGSGWNGYLCSWTKGISGRAVIAIDGRLVSTYTNYDTIILTSHAPLWVYENYFD